MRGKPVLKKTLMVCLALAVMFPMTFVESSIAGEVFPFEDVNNNGVYDKGIDNDISIELETECYFDSEASIVIPEGVRLRSSNADTGLMLYSDKDITIGDNVRIVMKGCIDIDAVGDVAVGKNATLVSKKDIVNLNSSGGNISLAAGTKIAGKYDAYLYSEAGRVDVVDTVLSCSAGCAWIYAAGDVVVKGSKLRISDMLRVSTTPGHKIQFTDNKVKVKEGDVWFDALGSTVDIAGTRFGVDDEALVIDADDIMD